MQDQQENNEETSKRFQRHTLDHGKNLQISIEGTKTSSRKTQSHGQITTEFLFPVQPRTIQLVPKFGTIVNHSYRDFSNVPAEHPWDKSTVIESMTFSEKVHDILCHDQYAPLIEWMPHGRAFKVLKPKIFEEHICQKYFGHSRYSTFLRSLNDHGFKHITNGIDSNGYYHECFLRGMSHLCKYMPRRKNARRLIPDPANEPDLYRISSVFPLPHSVLERGMPMPDATSEENMIVIDNNKEESRVLGAQHQTLTEWNETLQRHSLCVPYFGAHSLLRPHLSGTNMVQDISLAIVNPQPRTAMELATRSISLNHLHIPSSQVTAFYDSAAVRCHQQNQCNRMSTNQNGLPY